MTADKTTPDISDKLSQLQAQYFRQLPEKIAALEAVWRKLDTAPAEQLSILNELYRHSHTLMGSAGTFGAVQLSDTVKELDQYLKRILDENNNISKEQHAVIERLLYHVKQKATLANNFTDKKPISFEYNDKKRVLPGNNALIYVVDDDELVTQRIAVEMESLNLEVRTFNSTDSFLSACDEKLPSVIIMDVVFPDESDTGVQAINKLKKACDVLPPVVFISAQTNIDTRLSAVRAGAARYFNKPLDYKKLLSTVENLCIEEHDASYRVLIIDDAIVMAEYYAEILKQAGFEIRIVNSPFTVLDVMEEFNPDLVLMDLYMPECDGLELAAVIRQDDAYTNTSVVFLSSESDSAIKLKAIEVGADEFIQKPAEPEYLISTLRSRIKHSREMANLYRSLESSLRDNEYQRIALDSHGIVSIADVTGNIIYVNDKFCEISGYTRKELLGQNHRIVKSGEHSDLFYKEIWDTISAGKIWSGEIKNRRKNGDYYWVESTIVPFLDEGGLPYQYVSIRTDITPIMQIQEDLFEAKEQAEAASRAKTQFLSSMSHELRTPLNAILGFSQILLHDGIPEAQRDNVEEILHAGKHLLGLIDEVLDLAKIESDTLSVSLQPVVLSTTILESFSIVQSMAREKGIDIDLSEVENKDYIVLADPLRLKQVLINLLSNAIKYNFKDGHIKLYSEVYDKFVKIFVEDNGIGIEQDELNKLFKPFTRLVDHTYGSEGTGIGLFISRKLVESMGGTIAVKSNKGKGTTFCVELKLDAQTPQVVETGNSFDAVIPQSAKKYTVLYVEDNPVNMLLVEKILKREADIELLTAFTPEDGIEVANKHNVDLFLLDINLPGTSGYELLNYFKNNEATKDVKAIALSANAMESDIQKGLEKGFADYITKPIDVSNFVDKLYTVLES